MNKQEREAMKNRVAGLLQAVNRPKSQLLDIFRTLEYAGAKRKADQLDKIIGRLEAWQNSK